MHLASSSSVDKEDEDGINKLRIIEQEREINQFEKDKEIKIASLKEKDEEIARLLSKANNKYLNTTHQQDDNKIDQLNILTSVLLEKVKDSINLLEQQERNEETRKELIRKNSDLIGMIKHEDKDEEQNEDEEENEEDNDEVPCVGEEENKVLIKADYEEILDSCKLKAESFIKSFVLSISIYVVVGLCTERNFGLINVIASSTKTNHFFMTLALARLLFYPACFFMIGDSVTDTKRIAFFFFTALFWILTCASSRVIFPILTRPYYMDDTDYEISPPAATKSCIFILLFISNFISQIVSSTFWPLFLIKYNPAFLPPDLQEIEKRSFKSIILNKLKTEGIVTFFFFFLCLLIIGIGSLSNISNLNQDLDIFLFGYCFPIIKAAVVTVSYGVCIYASEHQHWSATYTSKMTSAFAMAAIVACTLSQLYIVFRNANDYPLFLSQYLPHEVIKKLSWLTFHPLYLKIKMQVIDILKFSCQKKDKVDPIGVKKESKRRFSMEVMGNLGATAGEIVGRQFGEDLCMIIICIWMLPISQVFLFNQIYVASSSLPFPSYENIGMMIIGAAYGSETILTILCFVILQRVGIPLMDNRQVLEFNSMTWGLYIFSISGFMLALTASF